MKKVFKIIGWSILGILGAFFIFGALFIYKVKNGFPVFYETERPTLVIAKNRPAILVFSKTASFRHGESIEASSPILTEMAKKNQWFLYETESGGVFNEEQLSLFDLVIFNNSTGPVLNDEQQMAFQKYITNGGNFLGIHGSGDDSHRKWEWYQKTLLGAKFSHHPLNPQFQNAQIHVEARADSSFKSWLVGEWNAKDEWYVFYEQPKDAQVLFYIDGDKILPSGNMLWMKDKNFGMGKYHPVAWFKKVGKGNMVYTSMGHSKEVWENKPFQDFIEKSISWTIK